MSDEHVDCGERWNACAREFVSNLTGDLRAKFEAIAEASWSLNWLPSMTADVLLLLPEIVTNEKERGARDGTIEAALRTQAQSIADEGEGK